MITARIYKPAITAMQSGRAKAERWILEYNTDAHKRPEPLMGWTQSEGTLGQIRLKFDSLEAAKNYADKNEIKYMVQPPTIRKTKPRNYGDNFKYFPPEDGDGKNA